MLPGCAAAVQSIWNQAGGLRRGTHQPDEAAKHESEHVADLEAQLPGGGNDDGIGALCPAQMRLLGLRDIINTTDLDVKELFAFTHPDTPGTRLRLS